MRRVICRDHLTNHVFLDQLSCEAKLLWLWLACSADDDGFIGSPLSEARYIGVSQNALQELIDTRYVLLFKSGVVVIKQWNMHNTIPPSRYKPTTYQDEFSCLTKRENGSYTEKDINAFADNLQTICKQNADNSLHNINQVKLSKVNLINNVQIPDGDLHDTPKEKPDFATEFAQLWQKYPNKKGKDDAFRHYKVQRKEHSFEEIDKKLDEYISFLKRNNTEKRYILNGSTWFNGRWKDEYGVKQEVSYDIEKVKARAERPIVYQRKN